MAVSNKPSRDRRSIESSGLKSLHVLTTKDTKDTKQSFGKATLMVRVLCVLCVLCGEYTVNQCSRQRGLRSSRMRSIGIASAEPIADCTVVAWNSELYTASSVASSAASNSGDIASGGRMVRARAPAALNRLRISADVENAMAKSPLPLL